MKVPFVDLKLQYQNLKVEMDNAISNVLNEMILVGGPVVEDFEVNFSRWMGGGYTISCGNGTDSLEIALNAMGIGDGDEVIVPAISWISSSEAVSSVGGKPVFVDVDDQGLINVDLIEHHISTKTKAIIPVHLYGKSADMTKIMQLAEKYNLKVLEDCAQAHGATWNGRKVGTFGAVASFSFYPGKNLGAYGDAGAMFTFDKDLAASMRMIANHGQVKKHDHQREGRNSRMDAMQAAVLNVKIKYLDDWNQIRLANAKLYDKYLAHLPIQLPVIDDQKHVFHLYVVKAENREALMAFLSNEGIQTAIHYPVALPLLEAYKNRGFKAVDFPQAIYNTDRILSLPMYPELTEVQIKYIADKITEFYAK